MVLIELKILHLMSYLTYRVIPVAIRYGDHSFAYWSIGNGTSSTSKLH